MADRPKAIKDALRDTLKDLVALHGAPGFEQSLVQYFRRRVEPLVDAVEVDRYGNVTATRRGRQDRPRLMISAHLDEIGFIVKGIEPDGFLRFDRLGGTADAFLPSRRVSVNGHFGIIGAKAGHLQSAEEQARAATVADMYIDVGVPSAADVATLGIRVGDPVTFIGELAEFSDGHRVCGKGMDDRAGVAILIQVLAELKGVQPFGTVHAVGTVLEQVGLRGAPWPRTGCGRTTPSPSTAPRRATRRTRARPATSPSSWGAAPWSSSPTPRATTAGASPTRR